MSTTRTPKTTQLTSRQKRNVSTTIEENLDDLRATLLKKAGIDEDQIAKGVADAWKVNRRLLKAKKQEPVVVREGRESHVELVEVEDNATQLQAVRTMYKMSGVEAPKSGGGGHGPTIVLELGSYYQPKVIDVTSADSDTAE